MFGRKKPQQPERASRAGYRLETESDVTVDPVDEATLHAVLTDIARTGDFFIVSDNADPANMSYIQGYTKDGGTIWQMEYQEGDMTNHWATEVAGGDVERIVLTWMSTRDIRSNAIWTHMPL